MKRPLELATVISLILMAVNKCHSFEYPTNMVPLLKAINSEVDLARQLFVNTNKYGYCDFDNKVCKSLSIKSEAPTVIAYQQISFVVHYPTTNECSGPHTEMSLPDLLLCRGGKITRTNSVSEIPVNYVRIVDPNAKRVMAEVDLLVGMSPLGEPHAMQYFRRSFWYARKKGWEEGSNAQWEEDAAAQSRAVKDWRKSDLR